jgi:hypothetical protein
MSGSTSSATIIRRRNSAWSSHTTTRRVASFHLSVMPKALLPLMTERYTAT